MHEPRTPPPGPMPTQAPPKPDAADKPAVSLPIAESHFRATLSRALSAAAITGFDHAASEGNPLTQLQQIDVLTMVLMAYHDAVDEARVLLRTDAYLFQGMGR